MKTGIKMKRLAFLNQEEKEILGFSLAPGQASEIRVACCEGKEKLLTVPALLSTDEAPGTLEKGTLFRAGDEPGHGIIIAEHEGLHAELLVMVSDRDSRAAVYSDSVV